MKKKVEVKSEGIVIGYTYDEGKTIEFLDNDEANKVKAKLFKGQPIGISSRQKDISKAVQDFIFNTIIDAPVMLDIKSIDEDELKN